MYLCWKFSTIENSFEHLPISNAIGSFFSDQTAWSSAMSSSAFEFFENSNLNAQKIHWRAFENSSRPPVRGERDRISIDKIVDLVKFTFSEQSS